MSSLRNAVKRITHKERAQPRARTHLGILEKKKDYKQRAEDYHRKQDRIRAMKEKAAMRNPDEFYFGMHKHQVVDGQHQKTKRARQEQFDAEIGDETIRLMKDQDLSYIRMQKQKDVKKAERLQSTLHFLEANDIDNNGPASTKKRKHTVFVETPQEAQEFDPAKHFDTLPELVDRSFNRLRKSDLEKLAQAEVGNDDDDDDDDALVGTTKKRTTTQDDLRRQELVARRTAKSVAKAREQSYRELQERSKRAASLARAEAHLVTEKLVAGKGRKRKIKEAAHGKPAQYKWRRKRLR